MKNIILTWENDSEPDDLVKQYHKKYYKHMELECLGMINKRTGGDIRASLNKHVKHLIVAPNLIEGDQYAAIISLIGASIFGYVIAENMEAIHILTTHHSMFDDAKEIISACHELSREYNLLTQNARVVTDGKYSATNSLAAICFRKEVLFVPDLEYHQALRLNAWDWNQKGFYLSKDLW